MITSSINTKWMKAAALLAGLSVVFGAFGAHTLKEYLETKDLMTWETACRYQMYHALALLIISIIPDPLKSAHLKWSAIYFLLGILLFSGSLYLISLSQLIPLNLKWIGPLTPIGGLFFILGWGRLILMSTRNTDSK